LVGFYAWYNQNCIIMVSLDRNESYWMLDDNLLSILRNACSNSFSTYPDYSGLKNALAEYVGVMPEQVLITPGSDSAIEYIAKQFVGTHRNVILPVPTFYGYETTLNKIGAKVTPVMYEEQDGKFVFPLEKTINLLSKNPDSILFICSPNNPLGCRLSDKEISVIAYTVSESNALLVTDEAYFEFSSGTTFLPFLAKMPNLIVIRTLSKSFGLAGARVGYAIASQDIVGEIERHMRPWEIAHPSVSSAITVLEHRDEVQTLRDKVIVAREHFTRRLKEISGITVYPSETNFILVRIRGGAERVRNLLLESEIRVAKGESMSMFPKAKDILKDTLRIAIPEADTEDMIIKTIKEVINKWKPL